MHKGILNTKENEGRELIPQIDLIPKVILSHF